MNKKLLITMIAMLTSITMLTSCGDSTSTSVDTTDTTDTTIDATIDATQEESVADDSNDLGEDFIPDEDFLIDMDNIEMSDEEIANLLGIDLDAVAETFAEGEIPIEFGSVNLDSFDIKFEASNFDFLYEGDIWIESGFDIEGTEVVIVDSNPVDFEAPANIYITPVSQIPSYISMNEYVQMVVDSSLGAFGVNVLTSGVDFYGDYEIGMIETVESYNEEAILEYIELGYFTEEDIEAIGGMDMLTSLPDMYQVFMVARKGQDAYTVSGAYYSNDIKRDEIINAIDGFMQSLEAK